jgi:hypothetical protein
MEAKCIESSGRKTWRKSPFARPKYKWEYNIKLHLTDMTGECGVDSSGSGQRPVVGSCESDKENLSFIKYWNISSYATTSFPRRALPWGCPASHA